MLSSGTVPALCWYELTDFWKNLPLLSPGQNSSVLKMEDCFSEMCINLNQSTLRHILEDRVIELIIAGTSNLTEILYIEQSVIL
jgi:hypothetical protein